VINWFENVYHHKILNVRISDIGTHNRSFILVGADLEGDLCNKMLQVLIEIMINVFFRAGYNIFFSDCYGFQGKSSNN